MGNNQFQNLKCLLLETRDLSKVQEFFFEEIAEAPWLLEISEQAANRALEDIVAFSATRLPGSPPIARMNLMRVSAYSFWHGALVVQGRLGIVLYFEDIQTGLLCIPDKDDFLRHARFSARQPQAAFSAN